MFLKLYHRYCLFIILKITFAQINAEYFDESVDGFRRYKRKVGKCNKFPEVGCYKDVHCPGYCEGGLKTFPEADGEAGDNKYAECSKNRDCKSRKCIYDECVFPTGVCEKDEDQVCRSNKDCKVCSKESINAGYKCKRNKQCRRGKCMSNNPCIFPTGFCEGNGNAVCESKYDCPGSCSSESRNPGDPCVRNNQCRGRGGTCMFESCIINAPSFNPSNSPTSAHTESYTVAPTAVSSESPSLAQTFQSMIPTAVETDYPSAAPTPDNTDSPTDSPNKLNSQSPSMTPTLADSEAPSMAPTEMNSESPSMTPTLADSEAPSMAPTEMNSESPSTPPTEENSESPSVKPTAANKEVPTENPSNAPSSYPSNRPSSPLPPSLEETLLNDKLFGPSSTTCSSYIPENGEYSFTFDLTSLPYFDNDLSDIEEVMFQVQMSHTDSANSNRTWAIKVGKGGHVYSFQGPYGESIPPNNKKGMIFVDEVNQKVCVDSAKNNDANGGGYFVHQSGVYQNGDPGYTDQKPYFFSPNVAIYCSTTIPECRMASWGQQSLPRAWSERIIYYDRYRDCGDGILERTHIIHNAEVQSTNTVLSFTNMPWGGTRYTTLKDFVFSQSNVWDYNSYNLPGGIEDPMLIFALDSSYGLDRLIPTPWTLGYTIFAEDLPFFESPSTPAFTFPGRLPAEAAQPTLVADRGPINNNWICQGPLNGFTYPHTGNYRCRFSNLGVAMTKGCNQCLLRLTNNLGDSFSVFNVRHWLIWEPVFEIYLLYFNSEETITTIRNVITDGSTITVSWDETGMRPDNNLALSFVHGQSENMVENGYTSSRIRYGHSNNVQRDFAVFEYISYPNLAFGDSFRARQYYITDQYAGLSDRSAAIASDAIEEVIPSGEFEFSQIHLHYINDGQSTTFGSTIDTYPCNNNAQTTTIACAGSSTPQIGKSAFLQIECGASTYVGTNFYHFSNYPTTPYRVMKCKVDGTTTSTRPSVKLLGYFNEADCGAVLQDKTYDANFCNN